MTHSELIEAMARAIWESQRRRIGSQDGINARLVWRDKQVPDKFWNSFVHDAEAALEVIVSYDKNRYQQAS